jgi:hypothetical protein
VCIKEKKIVKTKAYHETLKQKPPHITSLLLKRALKVGQPQKVPKHAQQVEEGLEGRSTSRGSETCSTSCKVWTKSFVQRKLITKPNISLPLPAPQILPLSLNRDLKV